MVKGKISRTMEQQAGKLFPDDLEEQRRFLEALSKGEAAPAVLWVRPSPNRAEIAAPEGPAWLPEQVSAVLPGVRTGTTQSFMDGDIYSFDLASAFSLVPLLSIPRKPTVVFDLCASPGGKAIGAWTLLGPTLLRCNEVIGKRLGALISNLVRCNIRPVEVYRADPEQCAAAFAGTADVVIADVPCSGQALVAKGRIQPGAFHKHTIEMNARRQRRVAINGAHLVAPGGYLLYTTCTFSRQENEEVIRWLMKAPLGLTPVPSSSLAAYQSRYTEFPCYRLFPQQGEGAGAFTCLLQRAVDIQRDGAVVEELSPVWSKE